MSELAVVFEKFIEEQCKACGTPLKFLCERCADRITNRFFQEQKYLRDEALLKPVYEQWLAGEIAAGHI